MKQAPVLDPWELAQLVILASFALMLFGFAVAWGISWAIGR